MTFVAYLKRAKIPIQIDTGFGDIVIPPSRTDYPTLLEFPGPRLLAYPKETVVAEKLQALAKLGIANTRMKDFYDPEILSRTFAFEGKTLVQAIQNTFQKRGTDLPMGGLPVTFTSEFYDDLNKKRQWTAFCAKNKSHREGGIQGGDGSHPKLSRSPEPHHPRGTFVHEDVEARRTLALKRL